RRVRASGLFHATLGAGARPPPASTFTATLGFVVIAVGLHAPAVMFLAFFPMAATAVGYAQLNRADPDCGTVFTWAARAIGPRTGWIGGWGFTLAAALALGELGGVSVCGLFLVFCV